MEKQFKIELVDEWTPNYYQKFPIRFLIQKLQKLLKEGSTHISVNTAGYGSDSYAVIEAMKLRLETDEELKEREARHSRLLEETKKQELIELKRLKEKYEN